MKFSFLWYINHWKLTHKVFHNSQKKMKKHTIFGSRQSDSRSSPHSSTQPPSPHPTPRFHSHSVSIFRLKMIRPFFNFLSKLIPIYLCYFVVSLLFLYYFPTLSSRPATIGLNEPFSNLVKLSISTYCTSRGPILIEPRTIIDPTGHGLSSIYIYIYRERERELYAPSYIFFYLIFLLILVCTVYKCRLTLLSV